MAEVKIPLKKESAPPSGTNYKKTDTEYILTLYPERTWYPSIGAKSHLGKATPLIWACQNGHTQTVKFLLEKGADINAVDLFGRYALRVAVTGGYFDTVKLLLDKSAKYNPDPSQIEWNKWEISPYEMAVEKGYLEIADLLKKKFKL
jgi:hypothetical protein